MRRCGAPLCTAAGAARLARPAALAALRSALAGRPRWLAASTHPGEDEVVARAHRAAERAHPGLLTILVPRHAARGAEVAARLRAAGLVVARRGAGEAVARDTQVYLADTMGELGLFYRLAPLAFIGKGVVLMPSFVNIGAYVDEGSMVDGWATVGSCAQIGKNVHLSGGVGIGGVLEPMQAGPTIIEDNCFIGARSEVVEGVIVGEGSVISMGVFIGQSTKIYDRTTGKVTQGYVPPGSVVVSGSLPAADGSHSLYCAVIVKRVDAQTRAKTSINELLRDD